MIQATDPGPSARILVVDDEPRVRSQLQELLRSDGHDVATAPDAFRAIERLANEAFELLITDIRMPGGMDGLELAERARSLDPTIGIIVVTGFASVGSAIEAIRRGIDDYVTKPFALGQLRARIGRIVTNRRLLLERDRLLGELRETNAELERHRELLALGLGSCVVMVIVMKWL